MESIQLDRLQAMNAAAQLVFRTSCYDHITPLLRRLHWLHEPQLISYKLAVMVYEVVRTLRTLDTSDPRHFGTGAEVSIGTLRHHRKNPRHFGTSAEVSVRQSGTSAEVSWTFRHHLHFVYRSVTLIYLFKKDYFIDD